MRSVYDNIAVAPSVLPQSFIGSSTISAAGSAVDTKLYNSAMLVVESAKGSSSATTGAVATLEESAASTGPWTPALDNTGTQIQASATGLWSGGAASSGQARIEGLGLDRKRYLRAVLTYTVNAAQTVSGSAELVLGRAWLNPVNAAVSNT